MPPKKKQAKKALRGKTAKPKKSPRVHMVGRGLFDSLKKLVQKATPFVKLASDATGIKPSDVLSKASLAYGPLSGVLGQVGSNFLKQQYGLGDFKKGDILVAKDVMHGGNFWDDFKYGFSLPFKAVGDLAGSAISGLSGNGQKGGCQKGGWGFLRGRGNEGCFNPTSNGMSLPADYKF